MGLKTETSIKGKPFDFNTQPDVAEMLQINLDELKSVSLARSLLISNAHKISFL